MAKWRNGTLVQYVHAIQISRWVLTALALFFLTYTGISTMIAHPEQMGFVDSVSPFVRAYHGRSFLTFAWIFSLGVIVGVACVEYRKSGSSEALSYFKPSGGYGSAAAVALLGSLAFWMASAWVKVHWSPKLVYEDPGGLFAVFMGVVTFVGFAVTLHDLRELKRRITTFPELMERLTNMLMEPSEEQIKFLAYTPALGYLALNDSEFRAFHDAMHGTMAKGMPRVNMTCLNAHDLQDWHDLFKGRRTRRRSFEDTESATGTAAALEDLRQRLKPRRTVGKLEAESATKMAEHIVATLNDEVPYSGGKEPRVKRLPFEFLPGYYFFVNSKRAIVVAPLQLPFPKGAPKKVQKELRTVQMLGLETNDRSIIQDLIEFYDTYAELPSTYVAETRDVVKVTDLEAWLSNTLPLSDALSNNGAIPTPPSRMAETDDTQKTAESDDITVRPLDPETSAKKAKEPFFQGSEEALEEVIRQLKIASGKTEPHPAEKDDVLLLNDYKPYFDLTKEERALIHEMYPLPKDNKQDPAAAQRRTQAEEAARQKKLENTQLEVTFRIALHQEVEVESK